jgi:hypothetical protein
MKTDELINLLSTNLEAVKGGELRNALMIALAVGAAAACCLMLAIFGLPAAAPGRARGTDGAPLSRDFVPWRFSDAGRPSVSRACHCRRPKTCT